MAQRIKPVRFLAPLAILALAGCTPDDAGSEGPSEAEASEAPSDAEAGEDTGAAATASRPMLVANTGWLSVGADGSVQTTFLDADGRYRDFRNGVVSDTGSWERRPDGAFCLQPDAGKNACWTADRPAKDGSVVVSSDFGKRIELKPISYTPPAEAGSEDGPDDGSQESN